MFYVGSNGPVIEKDPEIQKLREDVSSRMWDIIQQEFPFVIAPDAIAFVSYEDALKELAAMKNSQSF
jgi:hypothetical protein